MLELLIEHFLDVIGGVSLHACQSQLFASLLICHKFALNPQPTIRHLLPTIITHFFTPNSPLLLIQVPQQFHPSLLEAQPVYFPLESLLDALDQHLRQLSSRLVLFAQCDHTLLEIVFFMLAKIFTESLFDAYYFLLLTLDFSTADDGLEFADELFFRVCGLPLYAFELVVRALE